MDSRLAFRYYDPLNTVTWPELEQPPFGQYPGSYPLIPETVNAGLVPSQPGISTGALAGTSSVGDMAKGGAASNPMGMSLANMAIQLGGSFFPQGSWGDRLSQVVSSIAQAQMLTAYTNTLMSDPSAQPPLGMDVQTQMLAQQQAQQRRAAAYQNALLDIERSKAATSLISAEAERNFRQYQKAFMEEQAARSEAERLREAARFEETKKTGELQRELMQENLRKSREEPSFEEKQKIEAKAAADQMTQNAMLQNYLRGPLRYESNPFGQWVDSSAEWQNSVQFLNQYRQSLGLPPLLTDTEMQNIVQDRLSKIEEQNRAAQEAWQQYYGGGAGIPTGKNAPTPTPTPNPFERTPPAKPGNLEPPPAIPYVPGGFSNVYPNVSLPGRIPPTSPWGTSPLPPFPGAAVPTPAPIPTPTPTPTPEKKKKKEEEEKTQWYYNVPGIGRFRLY